MVFPNRYVCTLPVAMCEAFMKFNRSIIVIANIRYEQGRPEPDKWRLLNKNLLQISSNPRSVIAANNAYDQKYIEFFTGKYNIDKHLQVILWGYSFNTGMLCKTMAVGLHKIICEFLYMYLILEQFLFCVHVPCMIGAQDDD